MNKPTVEEVQAAVIRVKEQLRETSVFPEHREAVVSTLALFDLLSSNNKAQNTTINGIVFPTTFVEWTQQFTLKTHIDNFLAITVYLMENEESKAVNTSSMSRMYDKARWKKPANLADVFAKSAEKVFFTEAPDELIQEDGLKMWQITRTGYEHLQNLRAEN